MTSSIQTAIRSVLEEAPEPDAVLAGIHRAITEQRLPPGTKLNEEALAEVFGVSRTRVRAALSRLQHAGLVSSGRKQIARVARPSVREARELFAARRIIEPVIAADVARTVDAGGLGKLKAVLDDEHAARSAGRRMDAIRLAGEFHLVLAALAGNAVLVRWMREVVDRSYLVIFLYQRRTVSASCVHDEHAMLLQAIAGHDAEAASRSMFDHLRQIEGRMELEGDDEPVIDLRRAFEGIVARAGG